MSQIRINPDRFLRFGGTLNLAIFLEYFDNVSGKMLDPSHAGQSHQNMAMFGKLHEFVAGIAHLRPGAEGKSWQTRVCTESTASRSRIKLWASDFSSQASCQRLAKATAFICISSQVSKVNLISGRLCRMRRQGAASGHVQSFMFNSEQSYCVD